MHTASDCGQPLLTGLILAAALSLSSDAASQPTTGKVTGLVVEARTGAPLLAVLVKVQATKQQALSDQDGRFEIADVPSGPSPAPPPRQCRRGAPLQGCRLCEDYRFARSCRIRSRGSMRRRARARDRASRSSRPQRVPGRPTGGRTDRHDAGEASRPSQRGPG